MATKTKDQVKRQSKKWVNYQQLKDRMDFQRVLDEYGVEVTYRGDQAVAFCPFSDHDDKKSKSFSANLERNIFQCFGCGAKGNVLDFAVRMEGFDPDDAKAFREGALKVQERFGGPPQPKREDLGEEPEPEEAKVSEAPRDETDEQRRAREQSEYVARGGVSQETVEKAKETEEQRNTKCINAPLNFELKVQGDHEYLEERGLSPETIDYFGIGYCNRGLMKQRIAIPLHDAQGQLIGYAGRLVDDDAIDDDQPKYLLPGKRNADGVTHEFKKSEFLFNGHRLEENLWDLIVVEGFFQTMWIHQCGFGNVVGLMGSSMSEKQALLIKRITNDQARVFILPDGDEAGAKMAQQVLVDLGSQRCVRWLRLPGDNDPDDIAEENIKRLLGEVGL